MSRQGTSARSWSRRTSGAILCAVALSWCLASHAEEQRSERHRIVYRCMHDEVLTLTDMPCNGEQVEIDLNRNVTLARPSAARGREQAHRTAREVPTTDTTQQRKDQEARCRRLRAQLDTLRSKLRSGYTAAAGIRLEERKRQLRAQAKSAKCP